MKIKKQKRRSRKSTTSGNSKHFENILSSTESKSTTFLQIQDLDNSIFYQKRVPSRPDTQTHRLITQIELNPKRDNVAGYWVFRGGYGWVVMWGFRWQWVC